MKEQCQYSNPRCRVCTDGRSRPVQRHFELCEEHFWQHVEATGYACPVHSPSARASLPASSDAASSSAAPAGTSSTPTQQLQEHADTCCAAPWLRCSPNAAAAAPRDADTRSARHNHNASREELSWAVAGIEGQLRDVQGQLTELRQVMEQIREHVEKW